MDSIASSTLWRLATAVFAVMAITCFILGIEVTGAVCAVIAIGALMLSQYRAGHSPRTYR